MRCAKLRPFDVVEVVLYLPPRVLEFADRACALAPTTYVPFVFIHELIPLSVEHAEYVCERYDMPCTAAVEDAQTM